MAGEQRQALEKRNMWFIWRAFCLRADKTRWSGRLLGRSLIRNSDREDYVEKNIYQKEARALSAEFWSNDLL